MTSIHINMTERCNLNCKHCYALNRPIDMTKETLDKALEFTLNRLELDAQQNLHTHIAFLGREVGLINPDLIKYAIDRLKNESKNKDVEYEICSNITYNLTPKHLDIFKKVDIFATSFDPNIRFSNLKQRKLWFDNIKLLKQNNIDIRCIISVTADLIKTVSPLSIIDFMLALDLKEYNLLRLAKPITEIKGYKETVLPNNREQDAWLYEIYLLYEQLINPTFKIVLFESIKDALNGNVYDEFERTCQSTHLTISPKGEVSQCSFTQHKPFYNLIDKKLKQEIFDEWVIFERNIKDDCKMCNLLQFCRGDCCLSEWDASGCPSPKLIFNYLLNKGLDNDK